MTAFSLSCLFSGGIWPSSRSNAAPVARENFTVRLSARHALIFAPPSFSSSRFFHVYIPSRVTHACALWSLNGRRFMGLHRFGEKRLTEIKGRLFL